MTCGALIRVIIKEKALPSVLYAQFTIKLDNIVTNKY
jgi:hypothetical protein